MGTDHTKHSHAALEDYQQGTEHGHAFNIGKTPQVVSLEESGLLPVKFSCLQGSPNILEIPLRIPEDLPGMDLPATPRKVSN